MTTATAMSVEERLSRLENIQRIQDVLYNYARALDWVDAPLLDTVFFDDADIDYGFFKGSGRDFKAMVMDIEKSVGRRSHFITQPQIAIDGDTAFATTYGISIDALTLGCEPPSKTLGFAGFYHDRLECRSGAWAIARRKYLLVTSCSGVEMAIVGQLAGLNVIGDAHPGNPDYPG